MHPDIVAYNKRRANPPPPNVIATEEEMEAEYEKQRRARRQRPGRRPVQDEFQKLGKFARQVYMQHAQLAAERPITAEPVVKTKPDVIAPAKPADVVASEEECLGMPPPQGGATEALAPRAAISSGVTISSSDSSESVDEFAPVVNTEDTRTSTVGPARAGRT